MSVGIGSHKVSVVLAPLALGIGLSAWIFWAAPAIPLQFRKLERRVATLESLKPIWAEGRRIEQARKLLRARPASAPGPAPSEWLGRLDSTAAPGASPAAAITSVEGWNVERRDYMLSGIAPDLLGRWIEACERASPPWRLASARIVALDAEALQVRAELGWERVAESPAAAGKAEHE